MDSSTRELVDAAQVGVALAILSLVAVLATAVFAVLGWKRPSPALFRGALLSLAGMLAYPLWLVYNAIEDRFGLDSVAALLINLALFVAVGTGMGLLYRRADTMMGTESRETNRRDAEGAEKATGAG